MTNKSPKIEITETLQSGADEIISARNNAKAVYDTSDINADANEVE